MFEFIPGHSISSLQFCFCDSQFSLDPKPWQSVLIQSMPSCFIVMLIDLALVVLPPMHVLLQFVQLSHLSHWQSTVNKNVQNLNRIKIHVLIKNRWWFYFNHDINIVPGHSLSLQSRLVELRWSMQAPPYLSSTFLDRVLIIVPLPHVTEHSEESTHELQSHGIP